METRAVEEQALGRAFGHLAFLRWNAIDAIACSYTLSVPVELLVATPLCAKQYLTGNRSLGCGAGGQPSIATHDDATQI